MWWSKLVSHLAQFEISEVIIFEVVKESMMFYNIPIVGILNRGLDMG
jgi:hypothetical protein